ncbi:hypothetical protein MU1_31630 [Paenibacillus glycanilyticus]|uniref:Alpha-galactosidase n=1 Tax=Paenibacillus glycanilyticus TaxID=126569 RepID=A0ABQ6GD67_9BACL|nr:hypothetical protein MU1_31630 [Paenibacillus glycanilyticus]
MAIIALVAQFGAGIGMITPGSGIAEAASKEVAAKPYMGWSSYSMQVWDSNHGGNGGKWITAEQIKAQSDAMHEKLQPYGYEYINVDAAWNGGMDGYGRPIPSTTLFPDGLQEVIDYVHANGQKFGLYTIPGLSKDAYEQDLPIYNAPGCSMKDIGDPTKGSDYWGFGYKIDFSNPCAQKYIDSIADLFAQWGVDFLKLDSVTPGSGISDLSLDARDDVKAWSTALEPHHIWLELSWAIDVKYIDYWKQYANGWRVDWDIECYCENGLTTWPSISRLFPIAEKFWRHAGPGGWNDFDSLNIGNGSMDGITQEERKTAMSFWAISSAQLFTGNDLTKLDDYGLELLTNKEVIAVNQAGRPGHPVSTETQQQVWYANNGDGTYTVGLFNLGGDKATVSVDWSDIGLTGAASVRDLWSHKELGKFDSGFSSADLASHGSRLLKVTALDGSLFVNDDDTGMKYMGEWTRNGGKEMAADQQNLVIGISDSEAANSSINPVSAGFDKKESEQADVQTTMTLSGNTLNAIRNGGTTLSEGTDYTVENNEVTFKKGYLASLPVGTTNLSFVFSGGTAQGFAIAVSDTTTRDSRVTPGAVSFDKKAGSDIVLTVSPNGNALTGVSLGGSPLAEGTDYKAVDTQITIPKSYLSALPTGTSELKFRFDGGEDQRVALVVRDTSAGGTISYNNDHPDIHYVGAWNRSYNRGLGDYMDDVHFAEKNDQDSIEFTFNGTGVEYITELDPSQGDMAIYVDGEFKQTVSTSNLGRLSQQPVYNITGLDNGVHTLKAVKKSGVFMLLDQFIVSVPDLFSPSTVSFDKADGAQSDITIAAPGAGSGLIGIKNGGSALVKDTDYTAANDEVTLKKEYLASLPVGTSALSFTFATGATQKLTVTVSDSSAANSTISPVTGSFDKKQDAQADMAVTIDLAGNTLNAISNDGKLLQAGTDYEVAGNLVTLKKGYLAAQPVGITRLTFSFDRGASEELSIAISDSTPKNSSITPTQRTFDKKASSQEDAATTVAFNGNSLVGVLNGAADLTEGVDYTLSGNVLTVKKDYLAQQPNGMAMLTLSFSEGVSQTLAVTIIDSARGRYTVVNNDDTGISYKGAWQSSRDRGLGDYKNDVQYTEKDNDYFEYSFYGTGIELMTEKDPSQGNMDIYIDGDFKQTISTYNDSKQVQQTVFSMIGLTEGTHTIKAVKKSGYYMLLDAFKVKTSDLFGPDSASFDKSEAADVTTELAVDGSNLTGIKNGSEVLTAGADYTLSGNLVTIKKEYLAAQPSGSVSLVFSFGGDFHNDVHYTVNNGDYYEYAFKGTGLALIMPKGPSQGEADVYVDGEWKATVDAYHASRLTKQTVYSLSGLSNGAHMVKVVKKSGGELLVDGLNFTVKADTETSTPGTPGNSGNPGTPAANHHAAYMNGYKDGTFRPESSITRAEMASILSRVITRKASETASTYSDIGSSHWAKEAIEAVTKMGLMQGYGNGKFGPDRPVTRAEMAKLASLLIGQPAEKGTSFTDIESSWAKSYIQDAQAAGIMKGYADGTFKPNLALTRAETVAIINRILGRGPLEGVKTSPWKDVQPSYWAYGDIAEATKDHVFEANTGGGERWIEQ